MVTKQVNRGELALPVKNYKILLQQSCTAHCNFLWKGIRILLPPLLLLLHYAHLTASFPGQPGYDGTRKVNPVWI